MTATPTVTEPSAAVSKADFAGSFVPRHLGPSPDEVQAMLDQLGYASLDALIDAAVPQHIRTDRELDLAEPMAEHDVLAELKTIAAQNEVFTSMIGMGYHGTVTPPAILRNIVENPLWYTPYTPYQAEIAQGRLEALLNFQTMIADLTGLPLAGASLLDEATAAAEAMAMCHNVARGRKPLFLVAEDCHPQVINVVKTRGDSLGVTIRTFDARLGEGSSSPGFEEACGVLLAYPATDGVVTDPRALIEQAKADGAMVVMAADLLSLVLLTPPGQLGADIAIGSSQRFGVPMGFGGPHAAFMATTEQYARKMPGRIVGVSKDAHGNPAYRLAIQTREQHIKRDKATSNICTAQVLLAIVAGMYGVYHGPQGLRRIAAEVHGKASRLRTALGDAGLDVGAHAIFDTVRVTGVDAKAVIEKARAKRINLRKLDDATVCIACDETTSEQHLADVANALGATLKPSDGETQALPEALARTGDILSHPVFSSHHSEHELLRYVTKLQSRDISLANSMIPLGSCTMKLNAAVEMIPVTWPAFADLHPFAPADQTRGYQKLIGDLERWLADITGFAAVSMQPNAGSQGEYAGLLAIRGYHASRGGAHRDVCLVPTSAHGTNPASAVIAGYRIVAVQCDDQGNIDVADLKVKAREHAEKLACLMITYPSTHGVFEPTIKEICQIVHDHGGQVYMDGANMNAQVGLTSPGAIGADVCHLNLHKTFCIPHGGGGPGMGPIGVAEHLRDFLPGHPLGGEISDFGSAISKVRRSKSAASEDSQSEIRDQESAAVGPVAAAPYGSPMILPISWVYIRCMGAAGLTEATKVAILNANYVAKRLAGHYDVLYTGAHGLVAHEGIIDCRPFQKSAHITVEDIAKRLMDFGFHAPTMSWPVAGTLMIEPTESEPKHELDRFCDALIRIREEIGAIESGAMDHEDNPLKHAPHTAAAVTADAWPHAYGREQAAYPGGPWQREPGAKYWPPVARIDNPYGDRNLVCTCPSVDQLCEA